MKLPIATGNDSGEAKLACASAPEYTLNRIRVVS